MIELDRYGALILKLELDFKMLKNNIKLENTEHHGTVRRIENSILELRHDLQFCNPEWDPNKTEWKNWMPPLQPSEFLSLVRASEDPHPLFPYKHLDVLLNSLGYGSVINYLNELE